MKKMTEINQEVTTAVGFCFWPIFFIMRAYLDVGILLKDAFCI